jgi:alkylated DNA repair dioxygenase AlkB
MAAPAQPADQLAGIKSFMRERGMKYREPFTGVLIVESFAQKILANNPATVLDRLMKEAPVRRAGDTIAPGELQWVDGDNQNLMYRGNVLRRMKIWLQDGPPSDGTLIYSYTGYTYTVAPATSDWNADPQLASMCRLYNQFISAINGAPAANHAIVTAYVDGKCSIGMHSDKMVTLNANTIISVLKLGGASRRFCIRKRIIRFPAGMAQKEKKARQDAVPMLFDEDVASGDLIIMTSDANHKTQHGVPELETADAVGPSGSIVWRTAATLLTPDELAAKMAATEAGRAKRKAAKTGKRGRKRARA